MGFLKLKKELFSRCGVDQKHFIIFDLGRRWIIICMAMEEEEWQNIFVTLGSLNVVSTI